MNYQRHSGFTLIEILLGMSIMSVMMVLLFGSMRVCIQNWDAGEDKFAKVSQAAIIQNFFSHHLENLLPLFDDFSETRTFSFQGDTASLQFVSAMPASAGRLGLQLFTVGLNGAKRGEGQIMVSMRPFFPVSDGAGWNIEDVTILKNVKSLNFAYFGADAEKPNSEPVWQATWLDKTQTPLLVRIAIELSNGEVWPEQIVPLKVDTSAVSTNPFGIVNGRFTR